MRIVIDMQGAQAENRNRGIGRYTLSLAKAIVRNRGKHEVILVLNGLFPDTIEPLRAVFQDLLPQENIRVWHAPGPLSQIDAANTWRRQAAELTREAFLASLNPSVVLVSSLFEGLTDDAVTSIGALSQTLPTSVILYDLIPLINRSPYLDNPQVETWYEGKLAHLRRANLLLSISDSSRQEGIDHLGFPADRIVNISTAADSQFQPQQFNVEQQATLLQRYGIGPAYVMYTGGIDHRKNIEGLIRAYASLPVALRQSHQLAVVCSIQPPDRARLEVLATKHGLDSNELVLTGYVPEEDLVVLYNLCKVFVFPSWHEGFGLPALEAMACERAVIGANTSSLPEVIGCEQALFDPFDDSSITNKLMQVLTDEAFRYALEQHGLKQAKTFSWDRSAQLAIGALEEFTARHEAANILPCKHPRRPRLAYVSPLPPERSGISDYSAELLPELARHYDIEVVVAQDTVSTPWIKANCPVRTVDWFLAHSAEFDRVLYHFGNSTFHQHMFSLLKTVPGVVVLHDFFLSGIVAHMECHGAVPRIWSDALYKGHGYVALHHRFHSTDTADVVWKYPCNLDVLRNAQGVIVHSDNSRRLAQKWYGPQAGKDWALIPLLRVPDFIDAKSRNLARTVLGLDEGDFVVCSFGLLGPSKLNHRMLDAWLASPLAANMHCVLVFVGENAGGDYGQALLKNIARSGLATRIRITGWADTTVFRQYLSAADVAVQLRTLSRGETSAAVLDCMNYGLATIVNANGSMADLSDDGVLKLPDEFSDAQLSAALVTLWQDDDRRLALGSQAQIIIRSKYAPRVCADQYFAAIERFHCGAATAVPALIQSIARLESEPVDSGAWRALATAIDQSITSPLIQRQLFVDISELVQRDARSGIQRVVRSILNEWLNNPPAGYRVEPVYATVERGYRYARRFTLGFLGCPDEALQDEIMEYAPGDVFFGLDLQPQVVSAQRGFYQTLRRQGVKVQFVVYDLLCVLMPHCFPQGAADGFNQWLEVVVESDGALCISKAVADELNDWMKESGTVRRRAFTIDWFHLGADVDNSAPSRGLPAEAQTTLGELSRRKSFLMVGTLEPRKGHAQVLEAFEQLWQTGVDVNLVIVGKQGWMVESIVERLREHPERDKRLFWLDGISDEYLEKVYAVNTCLIAASYGEGFGLPLIEAAQHKLPIIARDTPVFREVAGEHAFYFDTLKPEGLARFISEWLSLYTAGKHPQSLNMPWLTWKESAARLLQLVLERKREQLACQ